MTPTTRRIGTGVVIAIPVALVLLAWRAASWRPQHILRVRQNSDMVLSPHSDFLVVGDQVWDLNRNQWSYSLHNGNATFGGFCDDKSYWSDEGVGKADTRTTVISRRDFKTGVVLSRVKVTSSPNIPVRDVQLTPSRTQLLVLRGDSLSVFDANTGRSLLKPKIVGGNSLVCGQGTTLVQYEATKTPAHLRATTLSISQPLWDIVWERGLTSDDLGVSPDGRTLWVVGDNKRRLVFLDARTGKRLWDGPFSIPRTSILHSLAFSPDGRTIPLIFSPDGQCVGLFNDTGIVVFDVSNGQKLGARSVPTWANIEEIELENSGDAFYSLSRQMQVLRWRLR